MRKVVSIFVLLLLVSSIAVAGTLTDTYGGLYVEGYLDIDTFLVTDNADGHTYCEKSVDSVKITVNVTDDGDVVTRGYKSDDQKASVSNVEAYSGIIKKAEAIHYVYESSIGYAWTDSQTVYP